MRVLLDEKGKKRENNLAQKEKFKGFYRQAQFINQ